MASCHGNPGARKVSLPHCLQSEALNPIGGSLAVKTALRNIPPFDVAVYCADRETCQRDLLTNDTPQFARLLRR